MNTAILLITNKAVRLQGKDYTITNPRYTSNGKLYNFDITVGNTTVRYLYTNAYTVDKVRQTGYCKLSVLDQYKNGDIKASDFIKEENWFRKFDPAEVGDIFEIQKVDFYNSAGVRDFEHYYNEYQYRFRITDTKIKFYNSAEYPVSDPNESSPTYSKKTHIDQNYDNSVTGRFYKKNFGDKVADLITNGMPDEEIEVLAYGMLLICFKIYWILQENLMDILAIKSESDIDDALWSQYVTFEGDTGNPLNTYNDLEAIDMMVAEIWRSWGRYYNNAVEEFEPKDFFPVLEIKHLNIYYNCLHAFYSNMSLRDENKLFKYDTSGNPTNDAGIALTTDPSKRAEKDSDRRIIEIINLLPNLGFSLFSPEMRLKLLDKALDYSEIYEDRSSAVFRPMTLEMEAAEEIGDFFTGQDTDKLYENDSIFIEDDIIRLVASFDSTYAEANMLLDFLLKTKGYDGDKSITKYERLYNLINDKGADNIAVVGWFFDEENNRTKLIMALYQIWQKSKYFFYSEKPGVPQMPNGTNPENYFLYTQAGRDYYADYDANGDVVPGTGVEPILEFTDQDLGFGYKFKIKYVPERLDKEKVVVNLSFDVDQEYMPDFLEWNTLAEGYYGSFHLYQTISLVGYKVDEDIAAQVPQLDLSLIPAFLFHYVEEFDRLKNIQATISFVIEVAIEVGLFFATAGASAATSLRHLRHLTKLGSVAAIDGTLASGVAASEVLLTWRVAEGVAEIVSVTAGVASSYLQYLGTVTDDPFKRRLSYFFVALSLSSAGGAIFSNRKVARLADDILTKSPTTLITHLQANANDVYQILHQVAGKRLASLDDFVTALDNLPTNRILDFYNGLPGDLKPKFFDDFGKSTGDFWGKLDNDAILANWEKLVEKNIAERTITDFLNNQKRVDTLVDFYNKASIRPVLEGVTYERRIKFLDNFHGIDVTDLNKFANDPDLVTQWFKYFDESVLRTEFTALNHSKQIRFLEDFGNASATVLNKFRQKPKCIKHWDECHVDFLAFRSEIKFLEELHHFKVIDPNAFDHLAFFKSRPKSGKASSAFNCTGGHTEVINLSGSSAHKSFSNGIEILDPLYPHTVNPATSSQKMIDYLNNTLNNTNVGLGKKYSKTPTPDGHFTHRDIMFKVDPQPATITDLQNRWVLNGELYEFKGMHTQYKASWTDQRIIHDMAFASKNKVLKPSTLTEINPLAEAGKHGSSQQWIQKTYTGTLLDGSEVMIKHVSYHRYNLQPTFNNHYSYFEIQ